MSSQEGTSEAKCVADNPRRVKPVTERNRCTWKCSLHTDVEFLFRHSASSKRSVVPGHSPVLAANSPVFFDMFTENMESENVVIEIDDCEPEVFETFLLHVYNDELELSVDCLQDVSRLATKYAVSSLVGKCVKYADNILCAANVFAILQCAEILKDDNLLQRCWDVVDLHANEVIKLDDFLNITESVMLELLQRDTLPLREIDLFKALCNWTTIHNTRQKPHSQNHQREGLYSSLVNQIRFPLMSQKEFAKYVPQTKLLSKDDIINMFLYFCSASHADVRFSRKPRAGTLMRCRLFPASRKWFMYSGSCPEYLTLSARSPLLFCGVRMFGSKTGTYSVSLELYVQNHPMEILTTKKDVYESESEMLNDYFGFDVFFEKPVHLEGGISYTLKVLLDGPPSFYGCHGFSVVECDGKTVSLSRENCPVFSRFRAGQFAEVIFM